MNKVSPFENHLFFIFYYYIGKNLLVSYKEQEGKLRQFCKYWVLYLYNTLL